MSTSDTARRVTMHEARRHFDDGGTVLVCEYGNEPTRPVYPDTTTHSLKTITWADLVRQVREWRHRYPNQRFYIVDQTWTFFGHWEDDRIVVEYTLPGEIQDERIDGGAWPEGLWCASASGATEDAARRSAIAEYEEEDEDV